MKECDALLNTVSKIIGKAYMSCVPIPTSIKLTCTSCADVETTSGMVS